MTDSRPIPSFSQVQTNHVYEEPHYRHLDITVTNLKGIVTIRKLRFKLFNSSGEVGLEFRQLTDWPRIFSSWPGVNRDAFGDVYVIVARREDDLSELDKRGRRVVAGLVNCIVDIVERATSEVANSKPFLADANLIREQLMVFSETETELFVNECEPIPFPELEALGEDVALRDWGRAIQQQIARVQEDFDFYTAENNVDIKELHSMVAEIRSFKLQLPQILNAVASAQAAARIVGDVRELLDRESGEVASHLTGFRREIASMWKIIDHFSKMEGEDFVSDKIGPKKA